MIFVIDLIKTVNAPETARDWEEVCRFFSRQPGFVSGRLLETIQTLHPKEDYKLTSVCCWETDNAWQAARQAAKNDAGLTNVLPKLAGKFSAFKGIIDHGSDYNPAKDGVADHGDQMVLVDVIYLTEGRMKAYAEMWHSANLYMSNRPGYIGACLHVTTNAENDSNKIKYINLAEWESKEIFFASVDTPEFIEIIKDFKNDFSLYLSKVAKTIKPAAEHMMAEAT
ncbi:hypothetical protein BBC27_01885 [Acidithiobacillus ferrivorans]|uniref:Uncharacterized protein n=1 Tax=Acidithiobacillus ferrivorans TaxID=160808 RepID=A0A1B9BVU5_9PROT|nr:antibiotic biosynthesis monooxygenase [Acidithiobacillus ferrivorans]OCB01831.1 hypothetical protein BBC27_01885 [Acidithiobacillus ferrivorans]